MYSAILLAATVVGGESPQFHPRYGGYQNFASCAYGNAQSCGGQNHTGAGIGCYHYYTGCYFGYGSCALGYTSCYNEGHGSWGSHSLNYVNYGGHGCYGCYAAPIAGCSGRLPPNYGYLPSPPLHMPYVPAPMKISPITPATPQDPPKTEPAPETSETSTEAKLTVRLPEDAQLYIDGELIPGKGKVRTFLTPNLEKGETYFYSLQVVEKRIGSQRGPKKRVFLRPGTELEYIYDPKDPKIVAKAR